MSDTVTIAATEYEALKADAERYRWLKANAEKDSPNSMVWVLNDKNTFEEPLTHFDEAIDQARKV